MKLSVRTGDLIKVEGGTLKPPWYGETGIVTSLAVGDVYRISNHAWYEVVLVHSGLKMIRSDMLVVLNEGR